MMASNRHNKPIKIEKKDRDQQVEQKNSNYFNFLLIAWFLESCALGPNLISQFILPPVIRVLFSITSVLVLVSLPGRIQLKKQNSVYNLIILAGLLIYNLGLIVSFQDVTTLDALIGRLLITITLIVAYVCMDEEVFVKCMDAYCKFMTFFAVSAIIVSAAVLIFHLPPTNEFTAPEGRVYQNYIIAFVEAEVDGLSGFKRAGSFYDEPGTFAVFLIPALLWTMLVRPSTVIFISLFAALILTFSIGGWVSFVIALLYVIKLYPDVIKKYRPTIVTVFFLLGVLTCLNMLMTFANLEWLSVYFDYKFTGTGAPESLSSAGTRQNEIDLFFTTLSENPLGYGIKSKQIPVLTIGLFASSIEAGFLGVMGYSLTVLGMMAILLENFISTKNRQSRSVVAMLGSNLSMLIMSTQRIDSLAFYTGIFMLSFMMNCSFAKQPKTLNSLIQEEEVAAIPEDEKFQEPAIVTAIKGSRVAQTISKIFEKSKDSQVSKTISKIFEKSKNSPVSRTVSKIFEKSKNSPVSRTVSKIFEKSKESQVSKTISKIFVRSNQSKSKKVNPAKQQKKSGEPDGLAELRESLKDLSEFNKK